MDLIVDVFSANTCILRLLQAVTMRVPRNQIM